MSRIIGFNFTNISAERKSQKSDKLEVNVNINIESIKEEKLDLMKNENVLKFDFEFSVAYKPELADIKLKGNVLATFDKEESKSILKEWKTKKISDKTRIPLFNFIMTKCNLRALQLEEELSLPSHVPMPRISPEGNKTNYTG